MKKLISLLETVTSVTPSLYPYVDFPAGAVGSSTPASDKINDILLSDINTATKAAGLNKSSVTTAVSGHKEVTKSGNPSRHMNGTGVDIAIINGVSYKSNPTKFTQLGDALVAQLKSMGYDSSGAESGHPKALLWQVGDHYNHVHVSNQTGVPSTPGSVSTSGGTSTSGSTETPATQPTDNSLLGGFLDAGIKSMGMSESRLEKDINKIKKLLK